MIFKIDRKKEKILQILLVFLKNIQSDTFTVHELVAALKERSFGILLLIVAILNACLIASIPMVSFIFGFIVILVSIQIIFRPHKIKLPNIIGDKTFFFLTSTVGEIILGIICLIHGILIILPIPLGNFLPGIALIFLALGVIEKDGLFIIIGYFLSIGVFLFFFKFSIFIYKTTEYLGLYQIAR
ncbi:MAG: exopolysaccharide biosynthesis protein, partial [Proteobacteria bacterium]|nr:exopolysaccharide biosynthesis protein [Pseudomonadota bacterium]